MLEVDSRTLVDGSGTVVTLWACDDGRFIVEAVNGQGRSAVSVTAHEAGYVFRHPFSRPEWLDYPGFTHSKVEAGLALAEARAQELAEV